MAIGHLSWDNRQVLEQNRLRLLKECHARMRGFESRYELRSDQVEAELEAGRLRETHEICEWLMDIHTVRRLTRDR